MPWLPLLQAMFCPHQTGEDLLGPPPESGWRTVALPSGLAITLWSAGRYDSQLAQTIRKAKYGPRWAAGRCLTDLMAHTGRSGIWQLQPTLMPIPPDPARLARRGFHLPAEMAKQLGRQHRCPVLLRCLDKPLSTPVQAGLRRRDRLEGLRGQFEIRGTLPKHSQVVLVDDVFTTGATLAVAALALNDVGAEVIGAVVLSVVQAPLEPSLKSRHVMRALPRRAGRTSDPTQHR